ncbi:MAG TPA: sulfurtransferase [Stellaceae bacterium]|jgi:thiosulfate/3-mercaptopyruvate sulfurtransferase|nr:sulfurtransferase [Stellaceae bacterium]
MSVAEGFTHPEFLIDTDALERQLGDPNLRVFDCTTILIPDPKTTYQAVPARADFEKGHIPGAQFIDLQADLSDKNHRLRFMLPSAEDFAAAMSRFGVGEGTRVVLYSTTTPQWATRVWWLLRVFGFDEAAVLDGCWQKWSREDRPVETGAARPRPSGHFIVKEQRRLMVGKAEVQQAIGDGAVCTLNALAPEQHAGTGGNTYGRPGRIRGSVNLPAAHLIDPATGAFLPAAELRRRFEGVGAFGREVITYCGGGIAASADAFALVMLGHPDVKLYDASMSEWATDPTLPMETG